MTTPRIREQFEAALGGLPGGPEAASLRRAALDRFDALGLPSRRVESWHYTDLTPLAGKDFDYVATPPGNDRLDAVRACLEPLGLGAGPALIFVDGVHAPSLAGTDGSAGVSVEHGAAAGPALLETSGDDPALVALNAAFLPGATVLRLDGRIGQPLELVFVGTGRRRAAQGRLRIELAAGAEATVVAQFLDLDADGTDATDGTDGESWLNLVIEIEQAESSRLTLHRLQTHGPARYHTALVRARLAREASLTAGAVELGGQLVRNEYQIALHGERADARVYGLALAGDRQHCDTRIVVDHRAAYTTSFQEYRAIAADRSRSVFNGKVIVREDAQHIEARQRNDNLLLSARAEIDTKPELEIYADQVICSHGATVGELGEDALFYLRARGIDENTARGILTAAFAERILQRIAPGNFARRVREAVDLKLPRRIELE